MLHSLGVGLSFSKNQDDVNLSPKTSTCLNFLVGGATAIAVREVARLIYRRPLLMCQVVRRLARKNQEKRAVENARKTQTVGRNFQPVFQARSSVVGLTAHGLYIYIYISCGACSRPEDDPQDGTERESVSTSLVNRVVCMYHRGVVSRFSSLAESGKSEVGARRNIDFYNPLRDSALTCGARGGGALYARYSA